jgi:hypothetical protein
LWRLPPTSAPSTRRLHTGVYAATLWVFDKPEKEHNGLYATVLTVLGAFLSFASIFLNSETYQRFRASYLASVKCQGCIFNATTCAQASMRDVAARTVSRFICGAYIMAFAGLRDSHYDADEVLHPFLQKYGLLTEEEWEALRQRGGFAGTGDRYRELISWTLKVVNEERDAGRCHGNDAWRLCSDILMLRGKLAVGYDLLGQPVPFVYVHLVRLLTICYLPVFAFVLARLGSRTPEAIGLACVAIVIACLFFLGINTVSTKLADPYGHDLDDLRILSHCKLMPGPSTASMTDSMTSSREYSYTTRTPSTRDSRAGACKSILTAELPAGTRASLRVET